MDVLTWPADQQRLLDRAAALLTDEPARAMLGIAGAPAGGKSTLTDWLVAELDRRWPGRVAQVGMDAFHLGHAVLVRRGQVAIKGAPETFDTVGYAELLRRLRETTETVYAPVFHREIEDSIAAEAEIGPEVGLVVTEGNYLLVADPPWDRVAPLLDESWFVHLHDDERRRRMVSRRLSYGQTREEAERWAYGSDEANARVVNATGSRADLWVEVGTGPPPP